MGGEGQTGLVACFAVLYSATMGWLLAAAPMALVVFALVHFIKYRSGNFIWIYIIIFLGPIGALVYIIVEVLPGLRATHALSGKVAKKKRIQYLEAVIQDNPSSGNYEELAELYREQGDCVRARDCFNRAIDSRTNHADPFYGRALCALEMKDTNAAIADLERTIALDRSHDYFRAMGLLAHCYALNSDFQRAEALFREALRTSTLSETQYNYAELLAAEGRPQEARELVAKILSKRATLSGAMRREHESWFKRATALHKRLEAQAAMGSAGR
jgi:hypothetical protein